MKHENQGTVDRGGGGKRVTLSFLLLQKIRAFTLLLINKALTLKRN